MTLIVNVSLNNIKGHPDNPRKDLGDLTELVSSIKKNGIMQNLTIMPEDCLHKSVEEQVEKKDIDIRKGFYALIGHRRLAAAKQAGLTVAPCRIVTKISDKEQVGMMLEENMQRNDLTIYEQAQGFQMMLDLGETAETIATKTGFSKTTIYHRLNIAKLDQKELKKKEQDDSFQLTLKNLCELEKIKDLEERNKILSEASNSNDLVFRTRDHIRKIELKEKAERVIKELEGKGVVKGPNGIENEIWGSKWETVKQFYLNEDEIDVKLKKSKEQLYWARHYSIIHVLKKAVKVNKKPTPEEVAWEERKRNKKTIESIMKDLENRRRSFVLEIIKEERKETLETYQQAWGVLIELGGYVGIDILSKVVTGKDSWEYNDEEKKKYREEIRKYSVENQIILALHSSIKGRSIVDYQGRYESGNAVKIQKVYDFLKKYGWFFNEDEEKIIDGTSELFETEE